jgi:hypothetical protein
LVVSSPDPASAGDSCLGLADLKCWDQVQAPVSAFAAILADGSVVTWGNPGEGGDSSAVADQFAYVWLHVQPCWLKGAPEFRILQCFGFSKRVWKGPQAGASPETYAVLNLVWQNLVKSPNQVESGRIRLNICVFHLEPGFLGHYLAWDYLMGNHPNMAWMIQVGGYSLASGIDVYLCTTTDWYTQEPNMFHGCARRFQGRKDSQRT